MICMNIFHGTIYGKGLPGFSSFIIPLKKTEFKKITRIFQNYTQNAL